MPWIPVDHSGLPVANFRCPSDLATARDHKVTAEDLKNKIVDEVWTVSFGRRGDGGPSTAAWYKVLSAPCAASGQGTGKIGVSYWSVVGQMHNIRYRPQWLWVFPRRRSCVIKADYFFVKQVLPQQDGPARKWVHVEEVKEDPYQEPQKRPQVKVPRQG